LCQRFKSNQKPLKNESKGENVCSIGPLASFFWSLALRRKKPHLMSEWTQFKERNIHLNYKQEEGVRPIG
jgi:hypothetical protein